MNLVLNTPAELQKILQLADEQLKQYSSDYSVNFISGFFAAILSSKKIVGTQTWLEFLFESPQEENIDSLNNLLQALLPIHNHIAMGLYDDEFKPMILESRKLLNWDESFVTSLSEWCVGYCHGVELCTRDWVKEQYEYSIPMAIFAGVVDIEEQDLSESELQELLECIPDIAQSVYNIGFDTREDEQIKNKVGRNDTCHCGSGKKYKKCCLDNDKLESIH